MSKPPLHSHMHLRATQANAQTKACKRVCLPNRTDTANLDGQTTIGKEGQTHNSRYPKDRISCFKDSIVVNQTLIFQIKFCSKIPALQIAANRYKQMK